MIQTVRTLLFAGCLLALAATATRAQTVGRLAGVVRDTTGGLLPGATVTVTGPALVAPRTAVRNDRGQYDLDNLPAGRYNVEASLGGFEPRTTAVDIDAGMVTLDVVLGVRSLSETVTVVEAES